MESSDSGTGVADCSVGAIVWVRRRNGSWWPGKILGPDELSASHLMSPRSGTPVKLLGREDASVDWYNLEKSKRVKAFRCGEFDDCIERAEASQGIPPKKRDKYARREDAILHALELEKQLLEKKYGELGCSSNGASSVKKELATSAEGLGCGNGKNLKSHQNSKGVESSHENKNKGHQHLHDNSDVLPRMKGLQDIGPRVKHKLSSSLALNGSQKPALVDSAKNPPNGDQSTENNILVSSKISLDKRKRSNEGVVEESLVKRRDRRRPLVQVLESSAKLPVPRSLNRDDGHVSPSISGERKSGERKTDVECNAKRSKYAYLTAQSSGCLEDKEIHSVKMEIVHSKFEESNSPPHRAAVSEENRSGSTEDTETDTSETDSVESDTDETIGTLSDDSAPIELIPKSMGRPEAQGEQECMSDEEPDDFAHISEQYPNSPISASVGGVSKWQIKGKRNNRGVTKRLAGKNLSQGSSRRGTLKGTESYGYDETESIHNNLGTQMAGYGSSGPPGVNRSIIDWDELAWNDEPTLKGYWVDSNEYYDPMFVGRRMDPMLIDVDLKVQSSYQREHVPMISLMSKLNGKAIVGHPIPVETLDNGSTEALLGAQDGFWPEPEMVDQDTALPPVWRTARRTANCRVPRPQGSRSRMDRKFAKKPTKKMSLSSSPKIRALSSIGMPHKHGSNKSYHQVDGLIKQESAAPTVVACIPVKLVFSRLHEALVDRHQ